MDSATEKKTAQHRFLLITKEVRGKGETVG